MGEWVEGKWVIWVGGWAYSIHDWVGLDVGGRKTLCVDWIGSTTLLQRVDKELQIEGVHTHEMRTRC